MNKKLAGILLFVSCILLASCSPFQPEGPKVSGFTFTNQHEEAFGLEQLEGKVWIADFIFTNCETVCPPMTSTMKQVQDELREQNLDAEIVSFSVDPTVDTPEILKEYLARFTDDDSNWQLLSGYSQKEIERFALDEFQTLVNKPNEADQVIHGVNFYVVNPDGILVNEFSFTDPEVIEKIVDEVKRYQ
ncbi:SCO family protein [Jeotgalibacillus proteolyticus]|uniref:Cytochrome c oxidase assembly protein n=1 Tax=Jeotgalibacillus proteolyticus TaxID=2082395 RepID=A0A2S5GCX2_9BACL|nr:SCO family protein [Jeotgalibacillus proteolyticus]PPA70887.1 cytochrome c oxidase assembly protein [Jeotgalibacillus proteolyticus]